MPARLHARVNGAGPTGCLCALALASAGWDVDLHDPLGPADLQARQRAYAFTHSSARLLRRLGLWSELRPVLSPFRRLRLLDLALDQPLDRAVEFWPHDLSGPAAERPEAAVGWIGSHAPLMALLLERLAAEPAVRLHLGTGTGSDSGSAAAGSAASASGRAATAQPQPDLVVAADGPASPTRAALGIGCWERPYAQACLAVQVQLRGCADDEAWELLRPEGPFAVLPCGDGAFQLVWSAPVDRCRVREALPAAAFLDALAGALPDRLQPDAVLERARAFPVALLLARRLHRGRTLLVGESAHRCHPVGGQGLNLCWRDVAELHRLAERAARGRLSPRRLPAAYARARWPDLILTLLATDLLVRVFSNRWLPLLPLRRGALLALARVAILRRLVLSAMTDGPCQLRGGWAKWRHGDHDLPPAPAGGGAAALSAPAGGPRRERP
jgi:2-octaprenyl-6-methoxyphenol hydroxylase